MGFIRIVSKIVENIIKPQIYEYVANCNSLILVKLRTQHLLCHLFSMTLFSNSSLNFISLYLNSRKEFVVLIGEFFKAMTISTELLEGTVLGPSNLHSRYFVLPFKFPILSIKEMRINLYLN